MKAISTGNEFSIYDDSLQVYDSLPAQSYRVVFSKQRGFFLEKYQSSDVNDEKVYGEHDAKVNKVMRAFSRTNRNLGVILSGAKGIGKTLFAKILGLAAIKQGMPLLIVDHYVPGISVYLASIEQECMVVFDEFDKTFGGVKQAEGAAEPQTEMLGLFDGIIGGKKLFVVTCNNTRNLSDYLLNRPGRFHYHFRFEYPTTVEIETYLKDKMPETTWGEIPAVLQFATRVPLNYDCLRAIAFELSDGETFSAAIQALNILNIENYWYNLRVVFKNGEVITKNRVSINMFAPYDACESLYDHGTYLCDVIFDANAAEYDFSRNVSVVNKDDIRFDDFSDEIEERWERAFDSGVERIEIQRVPDAKMHYLV